MEKWNYLQERREKRKKKTISLIWRDQLEHEKKNKLLGAGHK